LVNEELISFLLEDRQVVIDLASLVLMSSFVNHNDLVVFVDHSRRLLLVNAHLLWCLSIAQTECVFLLFHRTYDSSFIEVLRHIRWLEICPRKACIM